jgi:hypothetical protein
MNRRAGGNQGDRAPHSQPARQSQAHRTQSRSETSGAFEVKALAATARSAAAPAQRARPSELSGTFARRDSIVGMRVQEAAPRAGGGTSLSWIALGCAAVLLPGLGGVWYLSRASAAPAPVAAPTVAAALPSAVEIKPIAHEPAAHEVAAPPSAVQPRRGTKGDGALAVAKRRHPSEGKHAVAAEAGSAPEEAARPAGDSDNGGEKVAKSAEAAESPGRSDGDRSNGKSAERAEGADKTDKPEKPAETAEAEEDAPTGSPKTVRRLQATLSKLEAKVDQCHNRFQVDGRADVKVLVSPSGTVESLLLKGEFEGTPTGDCIVRQLSAASFPSFDGSDAIRISHSFSLE